MDLVKKSIKDNENGENEKDIYPSIFDEPFYFESDSLALKGNVDYSCFLKVLVLLEAQRVRACQDLENLIDMKEKALKEPAKFINYLNKKHSDKNYVDEEFKLPKRQSIYTLPKVDWNKYYDYIDINHDDLIKNENLMQNFQSLKRTKRSTVLNGNLSINQSSSSRTSTRQLRQNPEKNYNKSWGVEEQRTLEELLNEFPPEDNEAARWRKIATKLGTRTPLQVQSHCQKYFIKLAKAGLPVPGRMPNLKTYVTKKGSRGGRKGPVAAIARGGGIIHSSSSHHKRMIGRGSTLNEISSMWSSFNPPIKMDDDQEMNDGDYENSGDYEYGYDEEENNSSEQQFEDGEYGQEEEQYEESEYNEENDGGESQTEYENNNNNNQFQYISPKKEPIYADESDFYNNNNKV